MSRTTNTIQKASWLMLLLAGLFVGTASAQINVPADQPTVSAAVAAAADGATIVITPGTYVGDVTGGAGESYTFNLPAGVATGTVVINGNLSLDAGETITLGTGLTLEFQQNVTLTLPDGAGLVGAGVVAFTTTSGLASIFIPDVAAAEETISIDNLVINKRNGALQILNESNNPAETANLTISSSLNVLDGTFNAGRNDIRFEGDATLAATALSIAEDATISGTGAFVLATSGAAVGFEATGEGSLDMLLGQESAPDDGNTLNFTAIGNGGDSHVDAGTLFLPNLAELNGSLTVGDPDLNPEAGETARVELGSAATITSDLTLAGGTVVAFNALTVEENYIATGGTLALEAVTLDAGVVGLSQIQGDFDVLADPDVLHHIVLNIDADGRAHNLAIAGDLTINETPDIDQESEGANMIVLNGDGDQALNLFDDLIVQHLQIANDGDDVEIFETGTLYVAMDDDNFDDDGVTQTWWANGVAGEADEENDPIDPALDVDPVEDSYLAVLTGDLVTNGLLDANGTAHITISWTNAGRGRIQAGDADVAYPSNDLVDIPDEVIYTGNVAIFTADEIPGPATGGFDLANLTINMVDANIADGVPTVTLSKDLHVYGTLSMLLGNLDVGSARLFLDLDPNFDPDEEDDPAVGEQTMTVVIGDGSLLQGGAPNLGEIVFPDVVAGTQDDEDDAFIAGIDGINLAYVNSTDRFVSLEAPAATVLPYVIRDVTVNNSAPIMLRATDTFQFNGDVNVIDGTFDINGTTLALNAVNNQATIVAVDSDDDEEEFAQFIDGTAEDSLGTGLVRFIGDDLTTVTFGTTEDGLEYWFPGVEINRVDREGEDYTDDDQMVTFNANAEEDPEPEDALDRVNFTGHFTVTAAIDPLGDADGDAGVQFLNGLDYVNILGNYTQLAGEVELGGQTFEGVVPPVGTPDEDDLFQHFHVMMDYMQNAGDFYAMGDWSVVMGNFTQGTGTTNAFYFAEENGMQEDVPAFGAETFDLAELEVWGDFTVVEDQGTDDEERNLFALNTSELLVHGDYTFFGSGDDYDDDIDEEDRGINGQVIFAGDSLQTVTRDEVPESQFDDVIMFTCFETQPCDSEAGGVTLASDMTLNTDGELRLVLGVIHTNENQVTILNPGFENLRQGGGGRNNAAYDPDDDNVVELGTRDSYVNGPITRAVNQGIATGGTILDGYLFPTGAADDSVSVVDNDLWAPLVLQFSTLGRLSNATVQLLPGSDAEVQEVVGTFEPFSVESEAGERGLNLNILADMAYKVEFDQVPSEDPNIRIVADFLPRASVRDIKQLRFVQFPCPDGPQFEPRLAGTYDIFASGEDDPSAFLNDFINGVPNIFQEGVDVTTCQYFVVATDQFVNPILNPDATNDLAQVQVIHAVPGAGAVDVYVDDVKYINDLDEQEATDYLFVPVDEDGATIDVVAGNAENNDTPVFSTTVTLEPNTSYIVVASGTVEGLDFVVVPNSRQEARNEDMVDAVFINAANGVDNLDFVDYSGPSVVANNVAFQSASSYSPLSPQTYNIELVNDAEGGGSSIDVYEVALGAFEGEAVSMVAVGDTAGVDLLIVDADGNVIVAPVVTASEPDTELPAEFALNGNYPNPFNPATTISFNLPATAEVSIEVVDMLGRRVMTVPTQSIAAGANRTMQLDASMLASGTYLYRVTAKMGAQVKFETGRMTLVK